MGSARKRRARSYGGSAEGRRGRFSWRFPRESGRATRIHILANAPCFGRSSASVRPRQPQHVLRDEGEHHVRRDRCRLIKPRFPPLALDAVFACVRKPAEGLHAGFARLPGRFRRQHLAHVGFRPAGLMRFEHGAGLANHKGRGFGFGVGSGDRERDALVFADRRAEHDALLGVLRRAADEEARVAHAFRCYEDALGIHAVDDLSLIHI